MEKNSIVILIEKKNIFIAKSNYDITESILEIINKEIKDYRISDDK
jgi:Skp family chaperone for outer membrane proteins